MTNEHYVGDLLQTEYDELLSRLAEMEEDAERSGFRVARKFMKDGGSPEWTPEGTIDTLRAQRDEAVAALAVHDGHTEGLVADKRNLEHQRDEAVRLLREVLEGPMSPSEEARIVLFLSRLDGRDT